MKRNTILKTILIITLLASLLMIRDYHIASFDQMRQNMCMIKYNSYFIIKTPDNQHKIYLDNSNIQSFQQTLFTSPNSVNERILHTRGIWINKYPLIPSCLGRILLTLPKQQTKEIDIKQIRKIIIKEYSDLKENIKKTNTQYKDILYFLKRHHVQEEGYEIAIKNMNRLKEIKKENKKLRNEIEAILKEKIIHIKKVERFFVIYNNQNGKTETKRCRLIKQGKRLSLLQTIDRKTPKGIIGVYLFPWDSTIPHDILIAGFNENKNLPIDGISPKPQITPGTYQNHKINLATEIAGNGSAVYNEKGVFIGIIRDGHIIGRKEIKEILH